MNEDTAGLIKLLGGGASFAALLYLLYLVGMRIVAALDRVANKVDAHTAADLASHGEMREDIAALRGEVQGFLGAAEHFTPVGVEIPQAPERRPRTNPRGVPIGSYGPMRPGTKGGDR